LQNVLNFISIATSKVLCSLVRCLIS